MEGGDRVRLFFFERGDARAQAGGQIKKHPLYSHARALSPCLSPPSSHHRADRKNMGAAPPLSEAYLASGGVEREEGE